MTSNWRKSYLVLVMALLAPGIAEAQAALGTRAAGLAGAFVGLADDGSAVYWNPAGLATGPIVSVLASFADDVTDRGDVQADGREQLTGRIVALSLLPVGIAYYRTNSFGTRRVTSAVTDPESREEVRRSVQAVSTSTVGVSLLHSLTEYIVVGATPKIVHGADTTTFDVDAGAMLAVAHVRLGLAARNLTAPAFAEALADGSAEANEIELSREVRLGAAWGSGWPGQSRVTVSVDGDLMSRRAPFGDRRDIAAGVETWWLDRRLGLRSGVRGSTVGEARAAVAAGASWAVRSSLFVEGHLTAGQQRERGWSVGVRAGF